MSARDDLLHKAYHSRDLARRARGMARYLTRRADIERVTAYAANLEALAFEIEQRATERDGAGDGVIRKMARA